MMTATEGPLGRRASLAMFFAAWLGLVLWKLLRIPGINMDEAWYALAARGAEEVADPLSGMTRYSGALPILLVRALDIDHGSAVLRIASVVCNGGALLALWGILRRLFPEPALRWWALPFLATLPVWLVFVRNAIEIVIFGPLLMLLGVYLLMLGTRIAAFVGAMCWGILIYNHLLGAFPVLSLGAAWLIVYRALPPIRRSAAALGLLVGLGPRLVALWLYSDRALEGDAAAYELGSALADLPNLPAVWWDTLNGPALYLRVVGKQILATPPYWLLPLSFFIPGLRAGTKMPRPALLTLTTSVLLAICATLATPRLAVRYMMWPSIALAIFFVQLGAAAIVEHPESKKLVLRIAAAVICLNVTFFAINFLWPFSQRNLVASVFPLGNRNRRESSAPFLPKDRLQKALLRLEPEQVIASPSISLPLRLLLIDRGISVAAPRQALLGPKTVFVKYVRDAPKKKECMRVQGRKQCFTRGKRLDDLFVIYRKSRP